MTSEERTGLAMGAVADQLLAVLDRHEQEEHDGEPCVFERVNAIGLLAHRLGLETAHMRAANRILCEYNRNCGGK